MRLVRQEGKTEQSNRINGHEALRPGLRRQTRRGRAWAARCGGGPGGPPPNRGRPSPATSGYSQKPDKPP